MPNASQNNAFKMICATEEYVVNNENIWLLVPLHNNCAAIKVNF